MSKDTNKTHWDSGVLRSVLRAQLQDLDQGALPSTAVHCDCWKAAPARLVELLHSFGVYDDACVATKATLRGVVHVHKGDVVKIDVNGYISFGEIWYIMRYSGMDFTCVSTWQALPVVNMYSSRIAHA